MQRFMSGDGNTDREHASLGLEDRENEPRTKRPISPRLMLRCACPTLLLAVIATVVLVVLNGRGTKGEIVKD